MIIIGLCGKRGVGKDTAGAVLQQLGYRRYAFADALKAEVASRFGLHIGWLHHPVLKDAPLSRDLTLRLGIPEDWIGPRGITPREIMQRWADVRKRERRDYWLRRVVERMRVERPAKAVITDVRYPEEAAALRGVPGADTWIVRIDRVRGRAAPARAYAADMHDSERVERVRVDHRIVNTDGDLRGFRDLVRSLALAMERRAARGEGGDGRAVPAS